MQRAERFLGTVAAPLVGSPEVLFYSNYTVEEAVRRLASVVGPLALIGPDPTFFGKVTSQKVTIAVGPLLRSTKLHWGFPTFRGAFVQADKWIELRGRFVWPWFSRAWFAFWPGVMICLAVLTHSFVPVVPALLWVAVGDLLWWAGIRDRMEITAVIQRCLRSPEEAAAGGIGESR